MKTKILLLLIACLSLTATYLFFSSNLNHIKSYEGLSSELVSVSNLSFSYDASASGYILIPNHTSRPEDIISNVTLFDQREYAEFKRAKFPRSYPPSISISVFKNDSKLTPLEWAEANPAPSNIEGKEGEVSIVTIDGVEGIVYTVLGMFLIDVYVFVYDEQVYVVSGDYYEQNDGLYNNFIELVSTLSFS